MSALDHFGDDAGGGGEEESSPRDRHELRSTLFANRNLPGGELLERLKTWSEAHVQPLLADVQEGTKRVEKRMESMAQQGVLHRNSPHTSHIHTPHLTPSPTPPSLTPHHHHLLLLLNSHLPLLTPPCRLQMGREQADQAGREARRRVGRLADRAPKREGPRRWDEWPRTHIHTELQASTADCNTTQSLHSTHCKPQRSESLYSTHNNASLSLTAELCVCATVCVRSDDRERPKAGARFGRLVPTRVCGL